MKPVSCHGSFGVSISKLKSPSQVPFPYCMFTLDHKHTINNQRSQQLEQKASVN